MNALLLLAGFYALPVMATLAAPPQVAIPNPAKPAPHVIAVISCQIDDLGLQALPDNVIPGVKEWKNLDWHLVGGELQCKREVVPIEDKDQIINNEEPLNANFGEPGQCARAAALFFTMTKWDEHHHGWAVLSVGCPTPIVDGETGKIVGWHMPECPTKIGALEGIKCKFDESLI